MRIVVIGGSAAGLCAALVLARVGHEVTVLERDRLEPAADVEAAAAGAFRAGAPQIVQPHVMLATFRRLMRERLPDVYEELLSAGAVDAPLLSQLPPSVANRSPMPEDDQLTLLMSRRATVDWVLRKAAADEPRLTVRYGTTVGGLLAEGGSPPRVRGVSTSDGDLGADLVVDAAGRRSAVDGWLSALGARGTDLARAECGLAYFSRQYRLRPGPWPGAPTTRVVAGLDEFTVGIWGGDNDTMQMAVAPLAKDRRFGSARHPDVFSAVLRTVPYYASWLDVLEPITDVTVMGGLHNTLRRLVVDGQPVALGLLAVGDSVCTTNPTFGRGLSMAMRTVVDLADAVAAHLDDPWAQALALDQAVVEGLAPWYADQAATDAARLAMLRHTVLGAAPPQPVVDRVTFGQLRSAAQVDPVAFRGLWRVMGMLGTPDDVYADPATVERVRRVLASGNPPSMPQPSRLELETALVQAA